MEKLLEKLLGSFVRSQVDYNNNNNNKNLTSIAGETLHCVLEALRTL